MPIYEYECPECGHSFELIVRLNEKDNAVECPSCHSPYPRRLVSTVACRGSSDPSMSGTSCASPSGFS